MGGSSYRCRTRCMPLQCRLRPDHRAGVKRSAIDAHRALEAAPGIPRVLPCSRNYIARRDDEGRGRERVMQAG
jgi:hypothetical protein